MSLRFETLPAARVDALVSTRTGGVSGVPYGSLNVGLRVDDDPAAVLENRRRLFAAYDLPLERSIWCKQIHRDDVAVIEARDVAEREDGRRDRGGFDEDTIVADTDALVTNLVGIPLCVTLADCVPVVLYDPEHHAIGLAHAGWGGTVARISSRTVEVMRGRYGTEPSSLAAAIGPSISPARYEVGGDVIDAARTGYGEDADKILRPLGDGKALFDLWEANALDLVRAGVPREQIEISSMSTIDDLDRFYSHRAEQVTGRLAGIAMLRPVAP
ncbi:MAG: peptidoglycan editing factor PgeF [Solirubrobacteraceae bacterium]|nr:peptidoglycan editing factor PgeF [Solirubrobacteraceae bacterium]